MDRLPSKKASDVIHCLKAHMARHGLCMELCSDNSPFNSPEFRRFAQAYDFKHTTSSSHYPQSNGRADQAVKVCKRLMQKALEDRSDSFLALLAWRNTPSEQPAQSPSQIMFSRRTRTHLPTTDGLVASAFSSSAHDSLSLAKEPQASYYNRGAREKPPLAVGDVVRTRWKSGKKWDKATVVDVLPHRSYQVQFEDELLAAELLVMFGSRENPVVIRNEVADTPRTPAGTQTTMTAEPIKPAVRSEQRRAAHQRIRPPTLTRSGRHVIKPAKYNDFACSSVVSVQH